MQNFDSVNIVSKSHQDFVISYFFIERFNRAFKDSSSLETYDQSNINLFNIAYNISGYGKITIYDYLLDIADAPSSSSKTGGIRANMFYKFDNQLTASYQLEYTYQKDYGDNVTDYGADYILVEPGIIYKNIIAKLGYESLGSDKGIGSFQTPLATSHYFNGFADKFVTTPANGLVDFYTTFKYKINSDNIFAKNITALFAFHDFYSQKNHLHYGQEYDFLIKKNFNEYYNARLKFARYQADEGFTDTTKVMMFVGLHF